MEGKIALMTNSTRKMEYSENGILFMATAIPPSNTFWLMYTPSGVKSPLTMVKTKVHTTITGASAKTVLIMSR